MLACRGGGGGGFFFWKRKKREKIDERGKKNQCSLLLPLRTLRRRALSSIPSLFLALLALSDDSLQPRACLPFPWLSRDQRKSSRKTEKVRMRSAKRGETEKGGDAFLLFFVECCFFFSSASSRFARGVGLCCSSLQQPEKIIEERLVGAWEEGGREGESRGARERERMKREGE